MSLLDFSPTLEQEVLINHTASSLFVEACPGAGKTQTIVNRIKRQLFLGAVDRRGLAMISFTNKAVNEFKNRCLNEGIFKHLSYPNYIGTFDSFIWKFIALPAIQSIANIKPILRESWGDIYITLREFRGKGVLLDEFNPIDRKFKLKENTQEYKAVLEHEKNYVLAAQKKLEYFRSKGYYSINDARRLIFESLSDSKSNFSSSLGVVLKERFKEIIIDEAQDCNQIDIFILDWLRGLGIPVIIVCDLDQSIYEFRDSTPDGLRKFSSTMQPLKLMDNFRSAPIINKLAATLRENNIPDIARGRYSHLEEPIIILPYSGKVVCSSIGKRFIEVASELAIKPSEVCSLAHDRKSAMRAAGLSPTSSKSASKRFLLAKAVADYHNLTLDWPFRRKALNSIIGMILEVEGLDVKGQLLEQVVKKNHLDERDLIRRAIEIVSALQGSCAINQVDAWMEKAKEIFSRMVPHNSVNINKFFISPKGEWYKPLMNAILLDQVLPYATIHEAKGCEYLGVLLSINPKSNIVEPWSERKIIEGLRVLYVGVTRAKRLLGIGIPEKQLEELQQLFDRHQIIYYVRS